MDEFERLLKKRRDLMQKVTRQGARLVKEGARAVREGLESLGQEEPPKAAALPGVGRLEVLGLLRRQAEAEALLQENRTAVAARKRAETGAELRKKRDAAIHSAYFGTGGIRFHGRALLEQVDLLDPEQDDAKTMAVRCYNSAIAYMRSGLEKLERACAELDGRLADLHRLYLDDDSLYRAVGFTPCGPWLSALKTAGSKETAEALPKLRETVAANELAAETAVAWSKTPLKPVPPQKAELLETLRRLLGDGEAEALRTPEGQSPEDYAAAAQRYADRLRTELLDRFLLPGETPEERD